MIYLIITFLIVFGVIMLAHRYIRKVQDIPRLETEGTITRVDPPKFREDDSTFYFSYSVNGKDYKAIVNSVGAVGLDEKTPVGTIVTVLYDPNRPEDAYCRSK